MNANLVRHNSIRWPPAFALFALLAGFSLALAAPVTAGGLNDFQKKGNSSGSGGKTTPGKDSGDRARPSSDGRPERDNGSKPDVFDKKPGSKPANDAKANRPGPATPSSAGRGLLDIFRKQGKPQPTRPIDGGTRPVVIYQAPRAVIRHFYDPWYYPYDRYFASYYCPYVLRHEPLWIGMDTPVYVEPDTEQVEDRAVEALRNIERGWREGRYALIDRYVDPEGSVAIYKDGVYSHSLSAREYRALTLQAFADARVVRFRFYATRMVGDDEMRADGEHVFVGPDGTERRVELRYTLRRVGRHWYIRSIDMREDDEFAAPAPVDPAPERPIVTVARFEGPAMSEATLAPMDGVMVRPEIVQPAASRESWVTTRAPATDVGFADGFAPVLVASVEAPRATAAAALRVGKMRLVCQSIPLNLAAVRKAKQPLKAATITYVISQGTRATYEIRVSPAREGIDWLVFHPGEKAPREKGTVPSEKLKAAAKGQLCIVVNEIGAAEGDGRLPLFRRTSFGYEVGVTLAPKPVAAGKPVRTELVVGSKAQG